MGGIEEPEYEALCEQWVWLAKEALKSCTVGLVRIAIVWSMRGEVREFAAAVGFEGSVETLLDKVEDRFREKWTVDGLQQDFYKITQGKNEKVRQFTGRLKAQFKKLKEKVPGWYDNSTFKNDYLMGCINSPRILLDSAIRGKKLPTRSCIGRLLRQRRRRIWKLR